MSATTYLVDLLHDAGAEEGFKPLGLFRVDADHKDSAIELAYTSAREQHPDAGKLALAWVRPEDAPGGAVLGHIALTVRGGWRVHLLEIRDGGPGAVRIAATCGGIDPWVRVDSSLKPEEWHEWKARQVAITDWPEWAAIQRVDCPRCEAVYAKRRARAVAS